VSQSTRRSSSAGRGATGAGSSTRRAAEPASNCASRPTVASGISSWQSTRRAADEARAHGVQVGGRERRVGARRDHDEVLGRARPDQRDAGGPSGAADVGDVDAVRGKAGQQGVPEGVLADVSDHPDPCAQARGGDGLVAALPPQMVWNAVAIDRLAGRRQPLAGGHQVHVQAPTTMMCADIRAPRRPARPAYDSLAGRRRRMAEAARRRYMSGMAEAFNETVLPAAKAERYAAVAEEIAAVLDGEPNLVARMATVASMLANSFDHYFWTGFYVVDPDQATSWWSGPTRAASAACASPSGAGSAGRPRRCARPRWSTTSTPSPATSPATAVRRARSWCRCSTRRAG
jgi:hypothetical protein